MHGQWGRDAAARGVTGQWLVVFCLRVVDARLKARSVVPLCCVKQRDDVARSAQFIIHAALDMVDVRQWTAPVTCVAYGRVGC